MTCSVDGTSSVRPVDPLVEEGALDSACRDEQPPVDVAVDELDLERPLEVSDAVIARESTSSRFTAAESDSDGGRASDGVSRPCP